MGQRVAHVHAQDNAQKDVHAQGDAHKMTPKMISKKAKMIPKKTY